MGLFPLKGEHEKAESRRVLGLARLLLGGLTVFTLLKKKVIV
jgi:hypothetical protein